jgi:hypothetical protein
MQIHSADDESNGEILVHQLQALAVDVADDNGKYRRCLDIN